MIMDGESANQHIVGNGKLDPAVTISGALPSVTVANVITGTQDPMVSGQMTLKASNIKPQSASDQLLLAMQSATGGQAVRSGMVISPTKQAFHASGLKGLGTTIPASLGNSTSTQQLLLSPPIQTLQSPQQVLTNQLSGAQQIFTIPSNNAAGQQQVLTLPITNAAGQQQILTIPVSLAQSSGGIQFLIPTTGGQLLAANIGGVMPTMASNSTTAPSQTNVTSVLSGLTQTTAVNKQYTTTAAAAANAAIAAGATTTAATTPLPSMSVLASQTGLGQLPLPQMLMNATGLNSSARALAAAGLATMVSAPPLTQVQQQTTAPPALMTTTQRVAAPAAAATTTADQVLTTQQIAAHGLTGQLASTGQLLTGHGLPKQLITTQSPVVVGQAGAQAAGVQQLMVTQAVVGGTLVTSQAGSQGTAAQVKAPPSPTNNTATVAGSSSGKAVSSLGNTTEVDGINLEEIKEFAKAFKIRRLSLGLTQTQVGQALSATEGPAYSQSAICRFEKLDITPKSAQKIKPVLERWMQEAEERHKNGLSQLSDYIGSEPTKKRKRRTSFTPQALEYLSVQFDKNTHPSGAEMTAMSAEINYEREVIRVWFCNKRQALKNTIKKLKAVNDAGSPQETDTSEQVVVKTEVTYT
ncbi:POU domain, class 6, transcription factor 1-like isoform X3 [Patiria miniata]|uniref:POU domain protein n=1 Tax=Patiria miniata TaxID=46514 RepID=A0A913Z3E0_PATMI|nr:POU domain, class 6, transcription factor 1-like isoform X3 [Patiria miniata]